LRERSADIVGRGTHMMAIENENPEAGSFSSRGVDSASGKSAGGQSTTESMRAMKASRMGWYEKPAGKFCLGFCVLVLAEILVFVTLHWIFPLI
jgi:hypothetical protein